MGTVRECCKHVKTAGNKAGVEARREGKGPAGLHLGVGSCRVGPEKKGATEGDLRGRAETARQRGGFSGWRTGRGEGGGRRGLRGSE